jgi:sugar lactone lactonase YvrE
VIDNEGLFQYPAGIAIDADGRLLYVADFTRDRIFVLDLRGKILNRFGFHRRSSEEAVFDGPTEVAVHGRKVFVVDASGSRLQILDGDGRVLSSFQVSLNLHSTLPVERGFSVDGEGNIFVSNFSDSGIRIYAPDGKLLGAIGETGDREGQFRSPSGLWIDQSNRVFVADTGNRRVQVFQIVTPRVTPAIEIAGGEELSK